MIYTALIGSSTQKSLSSALFSSYAKEFGLDYAHLKIDVPEDDYSLKAALNAVVQLGFAGLNITIPHKLAVIEYLDWVDPFAHEIGAVNTVQIRDDKMYGYNTDYIGVTKTIEKALRRNLQPVDQAVVFGSGGAAKACVGAILKFTERVAVCYRSPDSIQTEDFKRRFKDRVKFLPYGSLEAYSWVSSSNILCNATPIGMAPDYERLSILREMFNENIAWKDMPRVFFDAVYLPLKTLYLRDALGKGCSIADGLDMMIYQGVEAFRLWTGKSVSDRTVQEARGLFTEEKR